MRVARIFDLVDAETGPRMADDHPRLGTDEAARFGAYLRSGAPVLMTTARMNDVVDPQRGGVVPMNFFTDGEWVWSEAVVYYLEEYGLEPEADLAAAIRARDFVMPSVDPGAADRAIAALQRPSKPAVWTHSG
ncbi:hypothetical protein GCM10027290_15550 [Micromonospora sonneratiae]